MSSNTYPITERPAKQTELNDTGKAIVNAMSSVGGIWDDGLTGLSVEVELSTEAVRRALKWLVVNGFVNVKKRKGKTSIYSLTTLSDESDGGKPLVSPPPLRGGGLHRGELPHSTDSRAAPNSDLPDVIRPDEIEYEDLGDGWRQAIIPPGYVVAPAPYPEDLAAADE